MTTLKHGSRGTEVETLQQKLAKLGFAVQADGIFGTQTQSAVEQLQHMFGYDTDGIVGSGTSKLIDAQIGHGWSANEPGAIKRALQAQGKQTGSGKLAGAELKRTLQNGMKGADVAYLQRRLEALGIGCPQTGQFDDATEKAVKTVQSEFGYDVDGIVGPATHTLINAQIGYDWDLAKKQAAKKAAADKPTTKVPAMKKPAQFEKFTKA